MSLTLTQLAYEACRDIGCLRAGTTAVQATDLLADILSSANEMLDSWQIDELMLLSYPAQIFTLVNQLEQYQIGIGQTGNNFNAPRPTDIVDANVIINFSSTPTLRKVLAMWGKDEWARIPVRALTPGSQAPISAIPNGLYYDRGFSAGANPFGTINIWPAPQSQPQQLEIFTSQVLPFLAFADTTTAYSFPPGYQRCLRKNLAVEIWPMMWDRWKAHRLEGMQQPSESMIEHVKQQAIDSKALVMSYNAPDSLKFVDPAFRGVSNRPAWVYATGTNGGRI
jgi:hypothetical protein